MKVMKETFTDNVSYEQRGEQFYPVFTMSKQTHYRIGKYGDLRLAFIKEHRKGTYTTLLTQFRLNEYLHQIDIEAAEQVRTVTKQLAQSRGIDEKLKSSDMLRWVGEMNNAKHEAEEIVLKEIVYR